MAASPETAALPSPSTGQTTTLVGPRSTSPRSASRDHPCVALVPGSACGAAEELRALLANRLRAAASILFAGVGVFFLRTLLAPVDEPSAAELAVHGTTALALAVATAVLWTTSPSLRALRLWETIVFGAMTVFFAFLHHKDIHLGRFLTDVEPGSHEWAVNLTMLNVSLRWHMLIVVYGTFIPNTWRRCLAAVGTMAAAAIGLTFLVCRECPVLGPYVGLALFDVAVVVSVAAATAIFGSHKISQLQEKAFEAQRLGQYRLVRLLGAGGMGTVYLGEHVLLRRACAIKTIRPDQAGDPATLERFEREVRAMAHLTHWNAVEVYDYGRTDDGAFYYVMEYLPGLTLQELVDRHGPMPPGRAIHFLRQVCAALKEAHGIGLIHRDIKPSNVLVCRRGGMADVAKLLDFGLVQDLKARPGSEHLTMHGAILGSPPYLSPEQAKAGAVADERTDVYGLGGLAFFLLAGRPPFVRDSAFEMIAAHLHEIPPSLTTLRADIPADVDAIVRRCLAKSPGDRYPDVRALDAALAACASSATWSPDAADAWWQANVAA